MKIVSPISVVVVDAKVVAIVAGVVIVGASVVVQINNFQKVFFVYHFIKEFDWKFYITVKVGKYKKVFCSIFKKKIWFNLFEDGAF